MKKIILILILVLISGCHYQEIDKLDVVSTFIIDYRDNRYQITLEIKEMKEKNIISSSVVNTYGNSLKEVFNKIERIRGKTLYFADIDILLISPNVIDKLDNVINEINSDYSFAFNFNMLLASNPQDIINNFEFDNKTFGQHLKDIVKISNKNSDITYSEFIKDYKNNLLKIPKLNIKENEFMLTMLEVDYE